MIATLEPLEPHVLLAAFISTNPPSWLQVEGTGKSDRIAVTISSGVISIEINRVVQQFSVDDVIRININSFRGNDKIEVDGYFNGSIFADLAAGSDVWSRNNSDGIDVGHREFVRGGEGDDAIAVGTFRSTLSGDAGNDLLIGGPNYDTINGGDGDDTIKGGASKDFLVGDDGDDIINGGPTGDLLIGGAGFDTLRGDGGNDSLDGGPGADRLYGQDGNDNLNGGGGNDLLFGGSTATDTILGGAGTNDRAEDDENDTYDGVEVLLM